MAYAARQQGAERFTSIGAVLLIHFVLAIVVINQFTPGLIQRILPPARFPTTDYTPPKKQPPPPKHDTEQPKKSIVTAEKPIVDANTVTTATSDPTPIDLPTFERTTIVEPPIGGGDLQKPLFTPKSPTPANSPSGWATTDDYPSASLKLDEQGMTTFRVSVGSDGRVKACEIVKSSGHKRLDDATCNLVSHRARFDPATDKNGEKVVGTYSNSVRWVLPN